MNSDVKVNETPMTNVPCQCFDFGTYVKVMEPYRGYGIVTQINNNKFVVYLSNGTFDNADEVRGLALPMASVITIKANQYK